MQLESPGTLCLHPDPALGEGTLVIDLNGGVVQA